MRLSNLLLPLFRFLIPPSIILLILLYAYAPLLECAFPVAKRAEPGCSIPGQERDAIPGEIAPFRLLAFGDPQLEGDTSLPDPNAPNFPALSEVGRKLVRGDVEGFVTWLGPAVREAVVYDIPRHVYAYRKRLDLWGNDLYLAHIYRSVSWWSEPTHVAVVGDLLGSQWIGDEEFKRRSGRFWTKVFKGTDRVPRVITDSSGRVEVLGADEAWKKRVIAVAGNHDIGYAGDIDEHRIERFEEAFGNVNWDIRFTLDNASSTASFASSLGSKLTGRSQSPDLHLVILNSMNLDSPAKNLELQQQSRDFAEATLIRASHNPKSATILLTHIPLHKESDVCVDGELFTWFPEGTIKEQNHLLKGTSDYLLNGLTDSGKHSNAIILNGHDHEGCDTYHFRSAENPLSWTTKHTDNSHQERTDTTITGIRELTLRSMMGSFSGHANFISAWYDREEETWQFDFNTCPLGPAWLWWFVHVFVLVVVGLGVAGVVSAVVEAFWELGVEREEMKGKVKKA